MVELYTPVTYLGLVDPGDTLSVLPSLIEQWEINNIYYGGTIDIVKVYGDVRLTIATTLDAGMTLDLTHKINVYNYLEIISEDSDTITVGYDGKIINPQ